MHEFTVKSHKKNTKSSFECAITNLVLQQSGILDKKSENQIGAKRQ